MTADAPTCGMACLCPGVRLADMRLGASDDGQYLLIYCRRRIVAILGSMGGNVEVFQFADAGRLIAAELIERIAGDIESGRAQQGATKTEVPKEQDRRMRDD